MCVYIHIYINIYVYCKCLLSVYDLTFIFLTRGFPAGSAGKESACNAGNLDLIPGVGKFPWRRERLLTPGFWPGDSPWGHKESGMTE